MFWIAPFVIIGGIALALAFGGKRAAILIGTLLCLWIGAWWLKTLTSDPVSERPPGAQAIQLSEVELINPTLDKEGRSGVFRARMINHHPSLDIVNVRFNWIVEDCSGQNCVVLDEHRFLLREVIPPEQARDVRVRVGFVASLPEMKEGYAERVEIIDVEGREKNSVFH